MKAWVFIGLNVVIGSFPADLTPVLADDTAPAQARVAARGRGAHTSSVAAHTPTPLLLLACLFPLSPAAAPAETIAGAARAQIGVTTAYDPAYRRLAYPGGDVPAATGVCCDVVIRALRTAHGLDLQQLVHEDMGAHFAAYPKKWALKKPDANIDHRRVPNLQTFFTRRGWSLPVSRAAADYVAGDIVTWVLDNGLVHIGVVSDRSTGAGTPLVIHNIGRGAREEDVLFAWTITGRYRPEIAPIAPAAPALRIRIAPPATH